MSSDGALADLRVLDLTRLLPGGFCTMLLADLGAQVLKVEDTGMGDYVRWAPPHYEGAEDSAASASATSACAPRTPASSTAPSPATARTGHCATARATT